MILKTRTIPHALLVYDAVSKRMKLSEEDAKERYNLRKGYKGELDFDPGLQILGDHLLVLNDLLLFKEKYFQLDTLVITGDKLQLYEVKNYEGPCYYKDGRIYNLRHEEILNNDLMVETKATYLRRLLHSHGWSIPLEAYTVFIAPRNFYLYQLPVKAPILTPGLLDSHFKKLNKKAMPAGADKEKLAKLLMALHIPRFPHAKLPKYTWEQLKKGIICSACDSLSVEVKNYYCYCQSCSGKERVSEAIVRSTEEFKLLFPEKKVTATAIAEWCGNRLSKTRVQRTLARAYKQCGNTHGTYYV